MKTDFRKNQQDDVPPTISEKKAKAVYSSIRNQSMEESPGDPLQISSAETHLKNQFMPLLPHPITEMI